MRPIKLSWIKYIFASTGLILVWAGIADRKSTSALGGLSYRGLQWSDVGEGMGGNVNEYHWIYVLVVIFVFIVLPIWGIRRIFRIPAVHKWWHGIK